LSNSVHEKQRKQVIMVAAYNCNKCNNLVKVAQNSEVLKAPKSCDCGSKSFTLNREQSEFRDLWSTSQRLWEWKDGRVAYLIGFVQTPNQLMRIKKEIESEFPEAKINFDVRVYGVVKE